MKSLQKQLYKCLMCVLLLVVGGCASLPDNSSRKFSPFFLDTQDTFIGKKVQVAGIRQGDKSGFLLLENGLDAFVARALLAQKAERSIDAQYYLLHNDVVGSLFIDQLYKAAERGVRVRLLVDDIGMNDRDFGAATLDSHANIEVRVFNPFSRNVGRTRQYIFGFGKQTRRAHNKSYTVDNQATIIGGRNIGDEYFDADPEFAFMDLDVLAVGPVVTEVSSSFDQYWNSELSFPISILAKEKPSTQEVLTKKEEFDAFIKEQWNSPYVSHLRHSSLADSFHNGKLDFSWSTGFVVADDPEKITTDTSNKKYRLSEKLTPHVSGIKNELILYSPYFVPGKSGLALFQKLRDRGVSIKILTNSLSSTDVSLVHAGYARYRKEMLKMGVQLYELNKTPTYDETESEQEAESAEGTLSLHAKCFVFDREKTFIGSLNLDARSLVQNTEIGLIFNSRSISTFIAEDFDQLIDQYAFRLDLVTSHDGNDRIVWHGLVNGEKVIFDSDPYTGFWKRFGISLMSILPIESQI